MNTVLHRADTRGAADKGWLQSRHTFSFSTYQNPARVHFGALRVLNDDIVLGGQGFGTHPHQDMEIVSIPLRGALAHRDSTGRSEVVRPGDVQLMSAGTGIYHSEFNADAREPVHFLQIWVLPEQLGIAPRYVQRNYPTAARRNRWQPVVAPMQQADTAQPDGPIGMNQQAWFFLADLDAGASLDYHLQRPANGVYLFVLEGDVTLAGQTLARRDGLGIDTLPEGTLQLQAASPAQVLLMEVPMLALA